MNSEQAMRLLEQTGAIRRGHFVGTNKKHFGTYVAKDRATMRPSVVSALCSGIAEQTASLDIDVVVAPAVGGLPLAQWIAFHIHRLRPDREEVLALYAERDEVVAFECSQAQGVLLPFPEGTFSPGNEPQDVMVELGETVVVKKKSFRLKRGFDKDVNGKRVLVGEDILTTGGSARLTVDAVTMAGGIVVGVAVLANGGKVTAEAIDVGRLFALVDVDRELFTKEECADRGLCRQGIPVNTDFGHGAEFLRLQAAGQQA